MEPSEANIHMPEKSEAKWPDDQVSQYLDAIDDEARHYENVDEKEMENEPFSNGEHMVENPGIGYGNRKRIAFTNRIMKFEKCVKNGEKRF